jgi:beta-lactamase regulating signal transducer with metallopeptidase domain
MTWILALAARSTLVLLGAALVTWVMRRASASARHAVWAMTLLGLLVLPALSLVLPRWDVPLVASRPPVPTFEPDTVDEHGVALPEAVVPPAVEPRSTTTSAGSDWALGVWLAGAILGLGQLTVGTLVTAAMVRRAEPVRDWTWQGLIEDAAARLRLLRRVELRRSAEVDLPVVWGYRRPVVLLPVEATLWPDDRRRAFLLHELAHVARRDSLTQTLVYVARAVYWPHPLVWWSVGRLRGEAERACDDRVLNAGTDGAEYARHLLDAARMLRGKRQVVATASAVVEHRSLGDRLHAVLDDTLGRRPVTARGVTAIGIVALAAVASVAAVEPVARRLQSMETPQTGGAGSLAARWGTITGSVVDESGHPVTSGRVKMTRVEWRPGAPKWRPSGTRVAAAGTAPTGPGDWYPTAMRSGERVGPATVDADGRFRVPLAGGTYVMEVESARHRSPTLPHFIVKEDATADAGRIVLEGGARIAGVVVDGAGAPVGGADVYCEDKHSLRYSGAQRRWVQSDRAGRFEFAGLSGEVTITTMEARYAPTVFDIDTEAPAGLTNVRMVLREGGRIVGTARRRDGRPMTDAHVHLGTPGWFDTSIRPDGTFTIEHVTPHAGPFSLLVRGADGYRMVLSQPVDIREGETTRVTFALREVVVAGRVTRAGLPVAGHRLELWDHMRRMSTWHSAPRPRVAVPLRPPTAFLATTTAADGTYELLVPKPGEYDVWLRPRERVPASEAERSRMAVPDVERFERDIALPE